MCRRVRERTVRVGAARPRVADVGVAARRRVVGRDGDGEATGDDGREVVDARGGDAKGRARVAKGDVVRLAVDEEVVAAKVGDGGERGADEEAGEEAHGVEKVDATALSGASLKMRPSAVNTCLDANQSWANVMSPSQLSAQRGRAPRAWVDNLEVPGTTACERAAWRAWMDCVPREWTMI